MWDIERYSVGEMVDEKVNGSRSCNRKEDKRRCLQNEGNSSIYVESYRCDNEEWRRGIKGNLFEVMCGEGKRDGEI